MKEQPRILIFTVASWNSKVGSNTWATLLEGYPSDKLASICIRDEYPDSNVCSRYFRISENRVIKSILKRSIKTGEEIVRADEQKDIDLNEHNHRYQAMKKNRRYSMLMARELIWKFGKWKTEELNEFLDDFKPDIILHSMEGYIHLNRIIEYAIDRTGAKAIGYIWDDNFTYKQSSKLGYKVYRYFQRRSLCSLSRRTNKFLAISDMTKNEADAFFGINSILMTKPLSEQIAVNYNCLQFPIKMIYTGKLIIGRDRTLRRIADAIKTVNSGDERVRLDVYTNTIITDDYRTLVENEACKIHPPVPQSEALRLQKEADVLLFMEDIDGADAQMARLSFSTKITDYLSSGKCIMAVGNKDTAPMQYFEKYDAALLAFDESSIVDILKQIIDEKSIIVTYAKKASMCGQLNHDKKMVLEKFRSVLEEVYLEEL